MVLIDIFVLLITIFVSASQFTRIDYVNIGDTYNYSCVPKSWYDAEISLITANNLVIARSPKTETPVHLKFTINEFDNQSFVKCTMSSQYYKTASTGIKLEIRRMTINASLETSNVYYYRENERYYFECSHEKIDNLYWIKVVGDIIRTGNNTKTSRLIEPFNLNRVDNDTKLYCFYYNCLYVSINSRTEVECTRVILKSITLQLKVAEIIMATNPESSKLYLLIAFIISLVIILILLIIISKLLGKLFRRSNAITSQSAAALQDETFYENQDFDHFNMPVHYADLDLDQTNGGLTHMDNTEYAEVTDTRTAKTKKKTNCCF